MTGFDKEIRKAAKQVHDHIVTHLGDVPYSAFTAPGARGVLRNSLKFRPYVSSLAVITDPHAVKRIKQCRERQRGFWRKLWESLWDVEPWPYTPIEFYKVDIPTIIYDKQSSRIICHPSLEQEIKNAIDERNYRK